MKGIISNYNELRNDPTMNFKKDDMFVFLICDGFERIPDSFKKYATEKGFFDIDTLIEKKFVVEDRDKKWKMKNMKDITDPKAKQIPTNLSNI